MTNYLFGVTRYPDLNDPIEGTYIKAIAHGRFERQLTQVVDYSNRFAQVVDHVSENSFLQRELTSEDNIILVPQPSLLESYSLEGLSPEILNRLNYVRSTKAQVWWLHLGPESPYTNDFYHELGINGTTDKVNILYKSEEIPKLSCSVAYYCPFGQWAAKFLPVSGPVVINDDNQPDFVVDDFTTGLAYKDLVDNFHGITIGELLSYYHGVLYLKSNIPDCVSVLDFRSKPELRKSIRNNQNCLLRSCLLEDC
jgi:hypothetical protein